MKYLAIKFNLALPYLMGNQPLLQMKIIYLSFHFYQSPKCKGTGATLPDLPYGEPTISPADGGPVYNYETCDWK